jgi:hypothetical protein
MSFIFDQPVSKRPRIQRKSSSSFVVAAPAQTTKFLDFLQIHRNKILAMNREKSKLVEQLNALKNEQSHTVLHRNRIRKKKLFLRRQLDRQRVIDLKKFDSMILPLLDIYYRQHGSGEVNHEALINMFKSEFLLTEHTPTITSINADVCIKCNQEYLQSSEEAILLCSGCGEVQSYLDASVSTIAYGNEIEYTSFSYKRINHLNEWLNHFQAKETTPVPDPIMQKIMNFFYEKRIMDPKTITYAQVKKAQKHLGLRKWYDNTMQIWCRITGNKPVRLDPVIEEKIRLMFIRIQEPFEKHRPKGRKNFLSYCVCLYKFCQILGQDHLLPYFSLLKGKEKLQLQEEVFKKICAEIGWKFIPIKTE